MQAPGTMITYDNRVHDRESEAASVPTPFSPKPLRCPAEVSPVDLGSFVLDKKRYGACSATYARDDGCLIGAMAHAVVQDVPQGDQCQRSGDEQAHLRTALVHDFHPVGTVIRKLPDRAGER